ncbi:MAG: nucleoside-triphosphatase [Anaerolineales bacterium]
MITRRLIFIISGEIDSGKTRLCLTASETFKELGWRVCGLASPGVFHEGHKVGIDAQDLQSGERRRLAELQSSDATMTGPQTKRWAFSDDTLAWCNSLFGTLTDCDLVIVDELGPLEFDRSEGLLSALRAIDNGRYRLALVVVRPSLLATAQARWPAAETLQISNSEEIESHMKKIRFYGQSLVDSSNA